MAFTDDFNRANENLEASANWTLVVGNAGSVTVESNAARARATATQAAYQCPDQGSADHYVQAAWLTSPNPGGPFICCRLTDADNFVGIRYQGNVSQRWELYKRVTGSFTLLDTHTAALVSGDVIRLEVEGNNARGYLNGVEVLTDTIDAASLTSTRPGLVARVTALNPWLDDFEAGTLGEAGITGTLATQESGADSAALAGAVLVSGALSATEPGADTAELAGSVLVSGAMDAAEAGSDTFASTSVVRRVKADDAPVRARRRLRPEQIIAIVEAIREAEEQAKPAPTRTKRKALARKIVAAVEDHIYAPARKPVEQVVRREVAQFYQPGITWAEVSTAVSRAIQAAEAEARRIEQEIEEEDETFLLLVA